MTAREDEADEHWSEYGDTHRVDAPPAVQDTQREWVALERRETVARIVRDENGANPSPLAKADAVLAALDALPTQPTEATDWRVEWPVNGSTATNWFSDEAAARRYATHLDLTDAAHPLPLSHQGKVTALYTRATAQPTDEAVRGLVERLKIWPSPKTGADFSVNSIKEQMAEAAALIRSQSAEIATLTDEIDKISDQAYAADDRATKAEAEIARLQALPLEGLVVPEDKGNHDCLAKRRPDEPMFILLGRDPDAHNIVRLWAERRLAAGGDPEHCAMGLATADRMHVYASVAANAPASAPSAEDYPLLQAAPSAPLVGGFGSGSSAKEADTQPAAEGPSGQWSDIASAPKDGTEVILTTVIDGHVYEEPATGRWGGDKWEPSWQEHSVIEHQGDFGTDWRSFGPQPTHWMPLPAAPLSPSQPVIRAGDE